MGEALALEMGRGALMAGLAVCAPVLAAGLLVGMIISIVLAATPVGIELKQEGRALTLMHPSSEPVLVSVSVQGSMTARFVDEETGMVTINNVYLQ